MYTTEDLGKNLEVHLLLTSIHELREKDEEKAVNYTRLLPLRSSNL